MRLTKKNITFYLLDKGFLDPDYFLSGDYTLTQSMSRNSIFRVEHQKDNGLFIKQLVQQDRTNSYLMQKDATSHYLIHKSDLYKETTQFIPKYYGYDPNHHILVTEYFKETNNIHQEIFRTKTLSTIHAKKMAQILASFHFDIRDRIDEDESLQFYSGSLPWMLKTGSFGKFIAKGTPNSVMVELQKNSELIKKLDQVAAQWEPFSLIHGDIKLMNFIVTPKNNEVKLIDWEIADLGDPLWDVAGVIQSYFSCLLLCYDRNYKEYVKLPDTEFITTESILPVVKIFWEEYVKLKEFTVKEQKEKLIKTLQYTAVRAIQTAFENNPAGTPVNNNSLKILHFSNQLLSDTEGIAKRWGLLS